MRKLLFVLLFVSLLAFGCCNILNPPAKSPLSLVPNNADMIASFKLSALLNDQDVQNFYFEDNNGKTLDDAFSKLSQSSGIDLREVSTAIAFSFESQGGAEPTAFILNGDLDETKLSKHFSLTNGWTSTDYGGTIVHSNLAFSTSAAFVSGNLIVGDLEAVTSVIDVANGAKQPIGQANPTYVAFAQVGPNSTFVFSREIKPGETTSLSTDSLGILNHTIDFSGISAFAAGLDKSGKDVNIQLAFLSPSSADAVETATALNGFKAIAGAFASPGSTLKFVASKIIVSTSSNVTHVSLYTTVDEIKALKAELSSQN